ncbi:MAG: hypothetical protein M0Q95_19370 [Porticoccaceae bacterium]|jgi:hypothetical protein|nr:hypothetical protein [Porticoccaceae bacterium]
MGMLKPLTLAQKLRRQLQPSDMTTWGEDAYSPSPFVFKRRARTVFCVWNYSAGGDAESLAVAAAFFGKMNYIY